MPRSTIPVRPSIACHMRELRAGRPLLLMAKITGVNAGTLSQIENGHRFPRPEQIDGLERGYGSRRDWYSIDMEYA